MNKLKGLVPIFDNGHAGVINGKYATPGKRSTDMGAGVLYEGVYNRWVVNRLMEKLSRENLPFFHVSPELEDVSLHRRVVRANAIQRKHPDAYLVSIHANAGGGDGFEIFTSRGNTSADPIAEEFCVALRDNLPENKIRADVSDGDLDKEAGFKVLVDTIGAAILVEIQFMDSQNGYDFLTSEAKLAEVVDVLYGVIEKLYKGVADVKK